MCTCVTYDIFVLFSAFGFGSWFGGLAMPCEVKFIGNSVSFRGHASPCPEVCSALSALSSCFEALVEACAEGYWIEAERREGLKRITWIGKSAEVEAGAEALRRTIRCLASQYPGVVKIDEG